MLSAILGWGYRSDWVQILASDVVRSAFLGGLLVALVAGPLGYFVVVRRQAFAAHALAHIGFPGATGAILLGVPVVAGLAVFCVAGGLAIGLAGRRLADSEVATGSILAFATGTGVLLGSLATRSTGTVTSVLFGNLLAITDAQLALFAGFAVILLGVLAAIARPLAFASLNPDVAEARGVPVRTLGVVFMALLGLVVTMAVQVVGTLLLFALVVTPAATALRFSARPVAVVAGATGLAALSVAGGLVLATMLDLPPSFFVVALSFGAWLVSLAVGARRARRP